MELTAFKQRLNVRAKAFVSDPDLVTDEYLTIACNEAIEIAGEQSREPVLMDIAYYRFLLLVETRGVDEEQFKAYQQALKQITDPSSPNASITSKVKSRTNPYR